MATWKREFKLRPVHIIIMKMKLIRTRRLSIKNSLSAGPRMLADRLGEVRKAGRRQALIIDLSGNAPTFLRSYLSYCIY